MKLPAIVAGAAMLGLLAGPALAGGGFRQHTLPRHDRDGGIGPVGQERHVAREPARDGTRHAPGRARADAGSSRAEQRPDPNYQNPYRPMYSFGATHPGEPHPYFQTRKEGFGYPVAPAARPAYIGNGYYVIPR